MQCTEGTLCVLRHDLVYFPFWVKMSCVMRICGISRCRMQLPEGLPPSFKGTAVQYVYTLEAHAAFSDGTLGPAPGTATSAEAALVCAALCRPVAVDVVLPNMGHLHR